MVVHYVKGLGMVEETEENLPLLIEKGLVKAKEEIKTHAKVTVYDIAEKGDNEQDSSDVKRTVKRKSTK